VQSFVECKVSLADGTSASIRSRSKLLLLTISFRADEEIVEVPQSPVAAPARRGRGAK
jgi:hypothetical protein